MPLSANEGCGLVGGICGDDIEWALSSYAKNKAPGLDGLPGEFYDTFRAELTIPLCQLYNTSYELGKMSDTMRTGVITIICKDSSHKNDLNYYRPISLLNYDAKILAKILDFRLSKVLRKLIGPHQFFD